MSKLDSWIETYEGKKFYPYNPQTEDICLEDIAHALSLICRFNGHCNYHYSVGQHSIITAKLLKELGFDKKVQLYALLHDASEAYCADIPRPVKHYLGEYLEVEDMVQNTILEHFGLSKMSRFEYDAVKFADNQVLAAEGLYLTKNANQWAEKYQLSLEGFEIPEEWFNERLSSDVKEEFIRMCEELVEEIFD